MIFFKAYGIKNSIIGVDEYLVKCPSCESASWADVMVISLYYHFYEVYADHTVLPHLGIRTNQYKLIYFYTVNEWELYDLKKDPQELHNVYNSKTYQGIKQTMMKKLF